jgi:hypothetical protein
MVGEIVAAATLPLMTPAGTMSGPVNSAGSGTLCVGVADACSSGEASSGESDTGVTVGRGVHVGVGGRGDGVVVIVGVRVGVAIVVARRVGVRVATCANAPGPGEAIVDWAEDCACAEAALPARQKKKKPVITTATSSARVTKPSQMPSLAASLAAKR